MKENFGRHNPPETVRVAAETDADEVEMSFVEKSFVRRFGQKREVRRCPNECPKRGVFRGGGARGGGPRRWGRGGGAGVCVRLLLRVL